MRLIEEVHAKLTIMSVREWESFQTILRSMSRVGMWAKSERTGRGRKLAAKFVGVMIMVLMLFTFAGRTEAKEEDTDEAVTTMSEVVVTATRSVEEIRNVAANVTVISSEDIAESGATSLVDILESNANILVRSLTGNPAVSQIDLRGFGENGFGRTLIMLDGRRLNRPDMSSINWMQVPLEQIERVEIVRGSGSVLYGDAAVAGVINIITKKGTRKSQINASATIGENNSHDERVGLTGTRNNFSYAINVENQETDGWRQRTAFESRGGGVRLGVDVSENLSISAAGSISRIDYELPGALNATELAADRTQFQPGHNADFTEGEYKNGDLVVDLYSKNVGDLSLQFMSGTKKFDSVIVSYSSFNKIELNTLGFAPKYTLKKDIAGRKNTLIAGLDVYREDMGVIRYTDAAWSATNAIADLERNSIGWYVRDEISINPTLIAGAGFRMETATIKADYTDVVGAGAADYNGEKGHDVDAFDVGLTWLATDNARIYGKFSTVYRYPFIDEQAVYSGWGSPQFLATLEAETGRTFEIGGEIEFFPGIKTAITLFRTDMEDEIALNALWMNENLDETRHEGLEATFSYKYSNYGRIYGQFTYLNATFRNGVNEGNDLPLVADKQLNIGTEVKLPGGFTVTPEMRYVSDAFLGFDLDNNAAKLKSYTVWNVQTRYAFDMKGADTVLHFGVKNLFDNEYSTAGYDGGVPVFNTYYPAPGREFFGGISGTF